jgi:hypothetical protein
MSFGIPLSQASHVCWRNASHSRHVHEVRVHVIHSGDSARHGKTLEKKELIVCTSL